MAWRDFWPFGRKAIGAGDISVILGGVLLWPLLLFAEEGDDV